MSTRYRVRPAESNWNLSPGSHPVLTSRNHAIRNC